MVHMTAEEYRQMINSKPKGSKHHNRFVYVYEDGFVSESKELVNHGSIIRKYDSKKEYCRHKELLLLERAGKICDLKWQVPMLIKEGFRDSSGKRIRPIYYNADFTYVQDGQEVVEDVKGVDRDIGRPRETEAFRLKWKLLRGRYPNKVFRIY